MAYYLYEVVYDEVGNILSTFLYIGNLLSACEVIEGIFKAGFFSAIMLGVLLVALIVWVASRFRK
jgi:hypothetical protein